MVFQAFRRVNRIIIVISKINNGLRLLLFFLALMIRNLGLVRVLRREARQQVVWINNIALLIITKRLTKKKDFNHSKLLDFRLNGHVVKARCRVESRTVMESFNRA